MSSAKRLRERKRSASSGLMTHRSIFGALILLALAGTSHAEDGWLNLFDGKTLKGWKEAGGKGSFTVHDGKIVAQGKPMGHLFYEGDAGAAEFKNFELKIQVLTKAGANGGVYFHTAFQQEGWPKQGIEAQVNATHSDWRKSGSIYSIVDVKDVAPHKDDVWWEYHIVVRGNHAVLKINDKVTTEWTQPEDWKRGGKQISQGTFALQAHDPDSVVYFKNIRVKVLD